ncbi:hypothetical protein GCM10023201_23060 [Actinomycetospora corticicola]|uniref:Putative membrane protein YeiB n=1 Tax=Actinomycetospora corticicola TaxID=663602 RepID=A0A7Y9DR36_9PSEU|nr:DUF418 domain-containing protein [Actinomycetospora corticicola]NYD33973.1 putative membrane protein YeiB [Actinomycetospora corticicola]
MAALTGTPVGVGTPGARIVALDVLRGVALCGILVINIYQQLVWVRGTGERTLPLAVQLIFFERFLTIFALLFGVGFGLFLTRAAARTPRPRVVLVRRLVALAAIGALHQFVHQGEVLLPYALVGLAVLLPLSVAGRWECLVIGVAAVLVLPQIEESFGLIVGLLILGFALARVGVAEHLTDRPGRVAVVGAVAGALTVAWVVLALTGARLPRVNLVGGGLGGTQDLLPSLAAVATAITLCCAVLLLLHTPVGPVLTDVFAPMGRMALTNYLAATVLFLALGPLLGIDSTADAPAIAALTVGILVVQIVWSRLWLRAFTHGPVEWGWRCVTWGRRAPLRRGAAGAT